MTRRTLIRRRVNWAAACLVACMTAGVAFCTWAFLLAMQAVFA